MLLIRLGLVVGRLPPPQPCHSRRCALLLVILSLSFQRSPHPSCTRCTISSSAGMVPPVASKVPRELVEHGDVRVDNYYWLRDDGRSDLAVLAHLRAENDYTAALMSDAKQLEGEIFAEIRAKIKEDDIEVPVREGHYYYYQRKLAGKEYAQHCRRLVPTDGPTTVHDVMPTGPDAPAEHIILDKNVKAEGHDYYSIGAFEVGPSGKLVAYAEDTKGDEIYTVFVIDAESGQYVGQPLQGITSDIEWAGDDSLVYVTMDSIHRPDKVWLHNLGSHQSHDICLYHEKDDMFSLGLEVSESRQYLFVQSGSANTNFIFYLDISNQSKELVVLTPRLYGIDTTASHHGNHFYITRRSEEFYNSELVACPLDNIAETTVLLPHRQSVKIQGFQLFENHLAVYERENGLPKATVYRLPALGESFGQLQGGQAIDFVDPAYAVEPGPSQFHSNVIHFYYSSMRTPHSVFEYDMDTGVSVLKKIDTVLGGFNTSNYVTERKWATASDGTQIPISILYRKDTVKLDGSDAMLLYGYGSYEECTDPSFSGSVFSLVDRGFI
ncbi:hypothetical protein ACQ4PT_031802 [Festuca glaucescens]